jgi:LysM repeat protein
MDSTKPRKTFLAILQVESILFAGRQRVAHIAHPDPLKSRAMQSRPRAPIALIVSLIVLVLGAGLLFIALSLSRGTQNNTRVGGVAVTLYPQPTAPATPTTQAIAEVTAEPATPAIQPSPTPRAAQYTVQPNDTLWDIALRFGFQTLDPILAANPGLNPDFLSLGQVLNIPGTDFIPPALPQPTFAPSTGNNAQAGSNPNAVAGAVMASAGGLRLRELPGYEAPVLTRLDANTPLQILGQVAGQNWLKVITPSGTEGYVDAQFVSVGNAVVLPTQPAPADAPPQPAIAEGPLEYPYLSDITPRVRQIFQAGQARGNRANAFSVIGDSNSQNPAFMKPIDWGNYNLGNYPYLQRTIDFFKGSFGIAGPASIGGFNTTKALDPGAAPAGCNGQSPLVCEYNSTKPSVALILLGTGDQHTWQGFEDRYRQIIQTSIDMGVIPVLITKADDLECRDNNAPCGFINGKIASLAYEYQVPLLNLRQVVERLPQGGTIGDGFHFSFPAGDKSAWFTQDYLQYGYNQRNLTALQTLDVLRRKVLSPGS